jgi:transcriptional regulator with XRE-family HTH domain
VDGGPESETEYLLELGFRVRVARLRRRVSQEELAQLAGISRVTLGSIERGGHAATVLTYRKLAKAFGTTLSDLLEEEPHTRRI